MARKIKERKVQDSAAATMYGWWDGKQTYIVFKDKRINDPVWGNYICGLDGHSLYRLAKKIVKEFEGDKR